MAYKITIQLSERDLRHFSRELRRAREAVGIADDEEILAAAADLLESMRRTDLPDFVQERFENLETMVSMLTDPGWTLDEKERGPVLAALAYLCDPEDIIPDDIPGIGLLDDAVMIELVFRETRHEIEAYRDFRRFRQSLPQAQLTVAGSRAAGRLARRREQLMSRMRRRRAATRRGRKP